MDVTYKSLRHVLRFTPTHHGFGFGSGCSSSFDSTSHSLFKGKECGTANARVIVELFVELERTIFNCSQGREGQRMDGRLRE